MVSFEDIKHDPSIHAYIKKADDTLGFQGFTEHGFAHVTTVSKMVEYILKNTSGAIVLMGAGDLEEIKNQLMRIKI